jgi:hypothetical protein
MKHFSFLLLASSFFASQFALAQCTPDGAYAGLTAGVYPGTSVNLPVVALPEAYSASLTINTETDTAISVNVGGTPANAIAYIGAMRVNAVNGLPPGFIHSTDQLEWINGGAAPSFSQVQGCISIAADAASVQQILQDNPSGASFPLELVLDARIHSTSNALINGVVSNTWLSDLAATVPGTGAQIITGYVLTVEPDVTGLNNSVRVKGSIYPNPSNGMLTLKTNILSINQVRTFSLLNFAGQEVYRKDLTQETETFNLPDTFASGIYLARILDENGASSLAEQLILSK